MSEQSNLLLGSVVQRTAKVKPSSVDGALGILRGALTAEGAERTTKAAAKEQRKRRRAAAKAALQPEAGKTVLHPCSVKAVPGEIPGFHREVRAMEQSALAYLVPGRDGRVACQLLG